jgi:DNA modification methylase
METIHEFFFDNAQNMAAIPSKSIDLIVTSPPYPMIEMWDATFSEQDEKIAKALEQTQGAKAFELMHRKLDRVWQECRRVLKHGGIACINIGDATRKLGDHFCLYANHARIQTCLFGLGLSCLPAIIWRKQTNAPNKFMGSGMLPPGAYVTLEHEYILIFRKGGLRPFPSVSDKKTRHASAIFWEERNIWFSDVWMDLKGTTQKFFDNKARNRSGAFPFELPYRLISMFSVKEDRVLDPFFGIGTTMYAAMAAGRNSIGFEIDPDLQDAITAKTKTAVDFANHRIEKRLQDHLGFVKQRTKEKGPLKHINTPYGFPVVTAQEKQLLINRLVSVMQMQENGYKAFHCDEPQKKFVGYPSQSLPSSIPKKRIIKTPRNKKVPFGGQKSLFDD